MKRRSFLAKLGLSQIIALITGKASASLHAGGPTPPVQGPLLWSGNEFRLSVANIGKITAGTLTTRA